MTTILLATEISGLTVQSYNSGNVNRGFIDTISSNIVTQITTPAYISTQAISGGTIITNGLSLKGDTISGLTAPIWPSSATNKNYVDTISGALDTKIDAKQDELDGSEYYPSSLGKGVSGAVNLNTTHRTSDGTDHTYIDQDVTNGASPTFTAENFSDGGSNAIITTTQETNFTSAYTWYTESSSKLSTISGSLSTRINALSDTPTSWGTLTEGTGIAPLTGIGISGSGDNDITVLGYSTISSNAQWASNWLTQSGSQITSIIGSGNEYSSAYESGQRVKDLFNHELYIASSIAINKFYKDESDLTALLNDNYPGSSNVNRALIDAISGNLDDKIDAMSDTPSTWGTLTAGTGINTLTNVGVSGAGATVSVDESAILTTVSSNAKTAYDWYTASSQKYSNWQNSGSLLGTAYNHSQDNTQAHTDYLLNNSSDTTSGELTAAGYHTTGFVSSNKISSNTIKTRTITDGLTYITISSASAGDCMVWLTPGPFPSFPYFKYGQSDSPEDAALCELQDSYFRIKDNSGDQVIFVRGETPPVVYIGNASHGAEIARDEILQVSGGIYSKSLSSQTISGGTIKGIAPITYSVANIRLSANQNINLAKFQCPANKSAYIYQANSCASGLQYGISGLFIEMLAGSDFNLNGSNSVYKTSSQIIQQGNPLGKTTAGQCVEIRLMYSGTQAGLTGIKFGTGMMMVGVY